jgi:hypothetical protein
LNIELDCLLLCSQRGVCASCLRLTSGAAAAAAAGGIFTHRDALGWQPGKEQMNKQGNWWLHALVHYDNHGEVLLMHRVTGEISVQRGTPTVSALHDAAGHARCLLTGVQGSSKAWYGATSSCAKVHVVCLKTQQWLGQWQIATERRNFVTAAAAAG